MLVNGVAILNNERFLERSESLSCFRRQIPHPALALLTWSHPSVAADGWGFSQMGQFNSLKMSIIGGIHAAQYFRSESCLFLPAFQQPY
jgi:hypothetical protein